MRQAEAGSETSLYSKELLKDIEARGLDNNLLQRLHEELRMSSDPRITIVTELKDELMPKINQISELIKDKPNSLSGQMEDTRNRLKSSLLKGALKGGHLENSSLPTDRVAIHQSEKALEKLERLKINATRILNHIFDDDIPESMEERKKINRDILKSLIRRAGKLAQELQQSKAQEQPEKVEKKSRVEEFPNIDSPSGHDTFTEEDINEMFDDTPVEKPVVKVRAPRKRAA